MRTLYLCYFGIREPLVQTQVLPYLRRLCGEGIEVGLLTFEPHSRVAWSRDDIRDWCDRLKADGIRWFSLPYHKRPSLPATTYDIAAGGWVASRLVRRYGYDVVHARAHVAAAMGAIAKRLTGCQMIFDIRGFNPEEYVDAGVWSEGCLKYRLAKWTEKRLLASADGFVVLTERAREILFSSDCERANKPLEVIPCCVDPERFRHASSISREEVRSQLGLTNRRVLVHVGSLGSYYLTDEMVDFLAIAHQQDSSTFSLILTQSPSEAMANRLAKSGVSSKDYLIRSVSPAEIPHYLRAGDLGLSFKKPSYATAATSPTKFAEYLAAGLPVISNAGIGDTEKVITLDRVGVILRHFCRDAYLIALQEADALRQDPGIAARCIATVESRFDLERIGGARYCRLYSRILGSSEQALDRERTTS